MKRLFGTDGIRAVAGESPLDPCTVRKFGAALAEFLGRSTERPRIALGRDTRESGPWLRDAVVAGARSKGAEAVDAGVVTTPGLSYITRIGSFDAGVMISASHNPFEDNGLKAFGGEGAKLPDEDEATIEKLILDTGMNDPGPAEAGAIEDASLVRSYVEYLEHRIDGNDRFRGLKLMLDCANGSAAHIAPEIFRDLGAKITTLGASPDGKNINLDCGSLHLEGLADKVKKNGLDLGIAFDGDADRALAVDRKGRIVDGDYILYLTARRLKKAGALRGDVVVATVMSNLWLEHRLADDGIRLLRAPVGDKYVLERMIREDAVLGGEQSGHIIFRDHAATGDGIMTGLFLLDTLLAESEPLESILDRITPYPQTLINVRVKEKPDLRNHPVIGPVVSDVEKDLEGSGRVVLRYSGTEPLARVMVESSDEESVRRNAERLAGAIRDELGV